MKPQILTKCILIICCCYFFMSEAHATNLRGQILKHRNNNTVPVANVRVDLMIYNAHLGSGRLF
jgi:hypothetical protein